MNNFGLAVLHTNDRDFGYVNSLNQGATDLPAI